jgi:hypothetical protein
MKKRLILFFVVFLFAVGVGYIQYYSSGARYMNPDVLKTLRGKELAYALGAVVSAQPLDEVKKTVKNAFPLEEPWLHNDVAHVLGEAMYRKYGMRAFGLCESFFNEGCYHGVIELLSRMHGPDSEYFSQLLESCVSELKDGALCSHPLGHAATILSNYNVHTALSICDKEYAGVGDKHSKFECWYGAIMEYNNGHVYATPVPNLLETTMRLCDEYPTKYWSACVQLQLHQLYFSALWNKDISKIAPHCRTFNDSHLRFMCAEEMGFLIAAYNYFSEPEVVQQFCNEQSDLREPCFHGAIRTYRTNNQMERAQHMCGQLRGHEGIEDCVASLSLYWFEQL